MTLPYHAKKVSSSSRRWAYFDLGVFLVPPSWALRAITTVSWFLIDDRYRTPVDAGLTGVKPERVGSGSAIENGFGTWQY